MKILNSMFLKWEAGTENAFINYALALKDCGFEVINLIHPKSQIAPKLKAANLSYIKAKLLGKLGKYDFFTIIYFKFLIKTQKINLVISHQGKLTVLFKKACLGKVKLIGVNHGHNPKHNVGTDLAITLNSNIFNSTIKLGQAAEKTALLPNCIDFENRKPVRSNQTKLKFTIGSYGRFSPEKGYDTMIKAIKILHDQNIDFYTLIGGCGSEEFNLKQIVKELNLENKVQFIGWVREQEDFFAKIDLFVLPSKREEFGLTILEAFLHQKLVLATKCSGPIDIIKDGFNGFLTDIENPKQMSEKIKFIINNKQQLDNITSNALETLKVKYSYLKFRYDLKLLINKIS